MYDTNYADNASRRLSVGPSENSRGIFLTIFIREAKRRGVYRKSSRDFLYDRIHESNGIAGQT